MSPRAFSSFLAAAVLLLGGCGEEKVAAYRVPKEKEPELPPAAAAEAGAAAEPAPGASMADTAVPTTAGADLVWEAPASWQPKAASAMRKASFDVPGAAGASELSITAFPGDVGGELANVNRWRGQVGLSLLRPDELESTVSRIESNGLKIAIVELFPPGDPNAKSILGAIVPVGGSTWFFKLTGPGASAKASKPDFIGFLHTVKAP
jgi:hypothetical protein